MVPLINKNTGGLKKKLFGFLGVQQHPGNYSRWYGHGSLQEGRQRRTPQWYIVKRGSALVSKGGSLDVEMINRGGRKVISWCQPNHDLELGGI